MIKLECEESIRLECNKQINKKDILGLVPQDSSLNKDLSLYKEWSEETRNGELRAGRPSLGAYVDTAPGNLYLNPWVPSRNHAESTSNRSYWGEQELGYLSSTAFLCAISKHFWDLAYS